MELLVGVSLGVAFLFVFYRTVKTDWPETYFGATDVSSYAISRSPARYAFFRFVPVYVTCVFVAVSLERLGTSGALGAALVGITYAFATSGTALITWQRSNPERRRQRTSIALLRAFALLGVITVAILAGQTHAAFAPVIPPISAVPETLWTAVIAGILGAFLTNVSRGYGMGSDVLLQHSLNSISPALISAALRIAREVGADDKLVRAVMVVENVQRPKWFRVIERLGAIVSRRRTYGIMQVASDRPLSDEESIRKATTEKIAGVFIPELKGSPDMTTLRNFSDKYNSDPNYRALLESAYILVWRGDRGK